MGEIFPTNASTMANTYAFILSNFCGFIAVHTGLVLNDKCGLHCVFFIPAGAIVASIILALIFMPETHGKSLDEIREIYGKKRDDEEKLGDQLEEEKDPYYFSLRSQMQKDLQKAIKQRTSVYAWPTVGGAQAVFELPNDTKDTETSEKGLKTWKKKANKVIF